MNDSIDRNRDVIVVAAAIIARDGRYLIARRKLDTHLGGFWEFPGGKCEAGESLEDCLRRELQEEIDVIISGAVPFQTIRYDYPEKTVELHFFRCSIEAGEAKARDCSEIRWVDAKEFTLYRFPPADEGILKALQDMQPGREEKSCMPPLPKTAFLKDGTPIELRLLEKSDYSALRALYEVIVEEGASYPHDRILTEEEFLDYWVTGKFTLVACPQNCYKGNGKEAIAGAFYLKPNWPGRGAHVANAGFIVAPSWRRGGLGRLLGMTMLDCARAHGYRSVIFNLVFAENHAARALWRQLGFEEAARLPSVVRKDDGSYQDAL
ncbi:MAG TPA: 8-oxo-dGTP diphosphatase MutT, partial [Nitrospiraceae bacterium]|nr:8-oxo-dGTP diphosphatase MutT [Nitrospiraceae bacterium]